MLRKLGRFIWRVVGPYDGPRKLVRCACGRVLWVDAVESVRKHHLGHQMVMCQDASFLWFLKMKLGLLNWRTLGEWAADVRERLQEGGLA